MNTALSAGKIIAAYRARSLSPVELVEYAVRAVVAGSTSHEPVVVYSDPLIDEARTERFTGGFGFGLPAVSSAGAVFEMEHGRTVLGVDLRDQRRRFRARERRGFEDGPFANDRRADRREADSFVRNSPGS